MVSADGTQTSVTINILGASDTAVLTADVRNLTETNSAADISTSGRLAISDLDAGEAHFQTQNNTAGQYGKFSIGRKNPGLTRQIPLTNKLVGKPHRPVDIMVAPTSTHTSVTIDVLGANNTAGLTAALRDDENKLTADLSTSGQLIVGDAETPARRTS